MIPREVEHTDEFEEWWDSISEEEQQEDIALAVEKLEEHEHLNELREEGEIP